VKLCALLIQEHSHQPHSTSKTPSKMVAIYIPVLQSAEPVYTQVIHSRNIDYKTTFILRALHACNEAKSHGITCLGTAVTYNRRCRNPLRKLVIVLIITEMIEAAENGTFYFEDLKLYAAKWVDGLSCYLHGRQKGVAMAALGAIAVYRQTFPGNVIVPRVQRLGLTAGLVSSAVKRHPPGFLSRSTTDKALELTTAAKKCDKSCTMLGASLHKSVAWIANKCDECYALLDVLRQLPMAEQKQQVLRVEKTLLSIEKVNSMLREIVLCLLESHELVHEALSVLAEMEGLLSV
jgi:hypothetical protein